MEYCRVFLGQLSDQILKAGFSQCCTSQHRKEQISNRDSLRLEIQALTDFLCSNEIEVLNVAGPRESKEPGIYEWTLTMLRLSLNRAVNRMEKQLGNRFGKLAKVRG